MRTFMISSMVLMTTTLTGCSMLGGGSEAKIALAKGEVSATKTYGNVLIANITGVDSTGNTGKAFLAAAVNGYGARSRPIAAVTPILTAIGAPSALGDVLVANYQGQFVKMLKGGEFAKAEKPDAIKLPADAAIKTPSDLKGWQALAGKVGGLKASLETMASAFKSGDAAVLSAELDKTPEVRQMLHLFNDFVFEKLSADYLLLTHVNGNEADWTAGKKIELSATLVNLKTGKLRFYGSVDAKATVIPVPFMAQVGIMSSNLFDKVNELDPLPPAEQDKDAPVAYLHIDMNTSH